MSNEALLADLAPILDVLTTLDLSDPKAAMAQLNTDLPLSDARIAALKRLFARGKSEGWLCHKEGGGSRFSRVAKPSDDSRGYSIDAVELAGAGVWHKHTKGEINLCFAAEGDPKFDGHAEGWVVFGPESAHVPTVSGGTMEILYFLPEGAVEWKRGG